MALRTVVVVFALGTLVPTRPAAQPYEQMASARLLEESWAVAYSGYREGQHPDRGDGAINPSRAEITEDLQILVAHGFPLIRLYDTGENSRQTLEIIRQLNLPIKVLLGIWLDAELSNHEGCAWLNEPIPPAELAENQRRNATAVAEGIALARSFPEIVFAVNVGNEALVEWTDHLVPVETVIAYVREVKDAITQPVTVAENYAWWATRGKALADELDFIGVHTYPIWEGQSIEHALAYTDANMAAVQRALPGKPLAILEAGWATTASEFPEQANDSNQIQYYNSLRTWAKRTNTTVFWFEAFDEPWKGDPGNPRGAEKHWGLFFVNRTPKPVMQVETAIPARKGVKRTK